MIPPRSSAIYGREVHVTELHNQDFEQMETAIQTFGQRLSGGGAGLFYFAGHGVQTKDNQNYLIPVGGTITAENVKYRAVNVGELTEQMQMAQNSINLIILDACRNNPWRGLRSGARGLAAMDAPKGTLIAYATAPGSEASDGTEGNGLYTKELLAAMKKPGVKVEDVFKQVRVAVNDKSRGQQTPWELSSLTGDFYFMAENDPPLKPTPNESPKVLTAAELRRNGSMRAVRERVETTRGTWMGWGGIAAMQEAKRIRWERSHQTGGDCMTCTGMCMSGAETGMKKATTRGVRAWIRRDRAQARTG